MERYREERKERWGNAPVYEQRADEYLYSLGFIIKINPINEECACDRFIYKDNEIVAGLEYKAKNGHPHCLLIDDKVFANLVLKAYEQRIPREKLYIAYYHPEKIQDQWIIFTAKDLLLTGLCKSCSIEYKSEGVEVYEINPNKVPHLNQHQLYQKTYHSQPIFLSQFLKKS